MPGSEGLIWLMEAKWGQRVETKEELGMRLLLMVLQRCNAKMSVNGVTTQRCVLMVLLHKDVKAVVILNIREACKKKGFFEICYLRWEGGSSLSQNGQETSKRNW